MERRFAVRYEELMAEAEVKPEALEGVLKRLDEFVKPFETDAYRIGSQLQIVQRGFFTCLGQGKFYDST